MTILISILFSVGLYSQSRGAKPIVSNEKAIEIRTIYSGSYALVIGNSLYQSWDNLPGVNKDIGAIKKVLEQHGFIVFTKQNLNKIELDNAFSNFIRDYGYQANNRLLFYFAGHGYTLESSYGEQFGYLVPVDAENPVFASDAQFKNSSIPMSRIIEYAKSIDSKHALFLFDACFSGSLINARGGNQNLASIVDSVKLPIRYFITSGSPNETVPDKSIFRELFVEALTSSRADYTQDGFVTEEELGLFLRDNVINYSYGQQHPQKGPIRNNRLDKGDFIFKLPMVHEGFSSSDRITFSYESSENSNNSASPSNTPKKRKIKEEELKKLRDFGRKILFNTGKSDIKSEGISSILEIVLILQKYPETAFFVEGHTDNIGDGPTNQLLSEKRASAVRYYLIGRGINASRLTSIGYGESKPIATNRTKSGRAQNRRIEFRLKK
ncbi:OmpA family protein [Flagellimonas onchidii]|uniref:OmpA family protein n=1 Tax=Flagellimonas onchidii TaxID=2562684 RepID=UPI001455F00B|nr:OmpA family protein [Allomuricauda onchidii]